MNKLNVYTGKDPAKELRDLDIEIQRIVSAISYPAGSTGWSVTPGYTEDKALNPEATSLTKVARVLGTLIDALKAAGVIGG